MGCSMTDDRDAIIAALRAEGLGRHGDDRHPEPIDPLTHDPLDVADELELEFGREMAIDIAEDLRDQAPDTDVLAFWNAVLARLSSEK